MVCFCERWVDHWGHVTKHLRITQERVGRVVSGCVQPIVGCVVSGCVQPIVASCERDVSCAQFLWKCFESGADLSPGCRTKLEAVQLLHGWIHHCNVTRSMTNLLVFLHLFWAERNWRLLAEQVSFVISLINTTGLSLKTAFVCFKLS